MAKQLPKQLEVVVSWAKNNTLAVVFTAIVILVPVGGYFAADMMGEGVRKEAQRRAQVYNDLTSASNAKAMLPVPGGEPIELEVVATDQVVDQFSAALEKYSKDATEVYTRARAFNNGSDSDPKHTPAVEAGVFPRYDTKSNAVVEAVRFKVADAIAAAYAKLLQDARAGMPPKDADVAKAVEGAELRYIQAELKQESRAKLSAEQSAQLDRHLGKVRIAEYTEAAKKISMYGDLSAFEVPSRASVTGLYKTKADAVAQDTALFDMQWKLWVATDIMRAFASCNRSAGSVLQSPVKQLMSLKVLPMEIAAPTTTSGGGEASAMGGEVSPTSDGTVPAEGAVADSAAVPAVPAEPVIDPKQEAKRDFSKRFTGRVSNGVYDVRLAEVTFVAETSKLPKVFDALAAENFMTVTNVRLAPADPFAAARMGYLYGPASVSSVTATVETVWFRDWTAKHMPESVRTALGITSSAPAPSGDGSAPADAAQGM
ncbi:MAG: hypothetical protein RLZZ116_916 [Planctomycetota bacterium]|jgi:hypothetical protein